ncbi:hypothetical protein L1887_28501 [Cichorium endivia]|nr:hypothetical protein L1887_28501 [Cichorium endivia]
MELGFKTTQHPSFVGWSGGKRHTRLHKIRTQTPSYLQSKSLFAAVNLPSIFEFRSERCEAPPFSPLFNW